MQDRFTEKWVLCKRVFTVGMFEISEVASYAVTIEDDFRYNFDEFGKTIFFTRDDAKRLLKLRITKGFFYV